MTFLDGEFPAAAPPPPPPPPSHILCVSVCVCVCEKITLICFIMNEISAEEWMTETERDIVTTLYPHTHTKHYENDSTRPPTILRYSGFVK